MWRATVPQQQVTRLGTDFDPFTAVVGEPLHPQISKAVPFWIPGRYRVFPGHLLVELFAKEMSPFADDESTVLGTVRQDVH